MLGHADFEAQNLRWHGRQVWAVHDWDSLAWQPEAALAGAASGAFASDGPPTLAPVESSEAFLVAYQENQGRRFTAVEQEIAWAASLWMAAYNVWKALHGDTRCPTMRSAPKQPNASAALMRSTGRQIQRLPPVPCLGPTQARAPRTRPRRGPPIVTGKTAIG